MIESNPKTAHANRNAEVEYDRWRSRLLAAILWMACFLGLFILAPIFRDATRSERITVTFLYIVLLASAIVPLPYKLKAGILVSIGYLAGLYTLVNFGPWSNSAIFFVATSIFGVLLFDQQTDLWITGICMGTIAVIGLLGIFNLFQPLSPEVPVTDLVKWVTSTTSVVVLTAALVWAVRMFKREFRISADQFNSTVDLIKRDRDDLERKVNEGVLGLTRKTDQLRAASYIARQTAEVQNLSVLLETVANLVTDQFGFYHTGIFLINETGEEAVLQAASSEGGRRMIERGHALSVGTQGIVGYVAAQKKPRIALDIGTDAVFFNNPDLPMTRSELALPLLIRNRVLGILDIQSDKPQAFNLDDIDVLQTLADQVAVAIENARLLDESQATLTQLEALTAVRTREAWSQKLHGKSRVFTFTPLGLRAEKLSQPNEKTITIPLTLRGQKIGNISIARKGDAEINKSDEDLIAEVASQVGLAIDNIRLLEEATQRARQEQIVGKLAGRFSQSLDIDTLLQTAVREMAQLPDISEVSVFIGEQTSESPAMQKTRRNPGQA